MWLAAQEQEGGDPEDDLEEEEEEEEINVLDTFPELQEEESLPARRSAPQSEAGSHVSSVNLTQEDLENSRAERELKLNLASEE